MTKCQNGLSDRVQKRVYRVKLNCDKGFSPVDDFDKYNARRVGAPDPALPKPKHEVRSMNKVHKTDNAEPGNWYNTKQVAELFGCGREYVTHTLVKKHGWRYSLVNPENPRKGYRISREDVDQTLAYCNAAAETKPPVAKPITVAELRTRRAAHGLKVPHVQIAPPDKGPYSSDYKPQLCGCVVGGCANTAVYGREFCIEHDQRKLVTPVAKPQTMEDVVSKHAAQPTDNTGRELLAALRIFRKATESLEDRLAAWLISQG